MSFYHKLCTALYVGSRGLETLVLDWRDTRTVMSRASIIARMLIFTFPYLTMRMSLVVIPVLLMTAMRRVFRAPVMRYFFPLALLSVGAIYVNLVSDDARFLSFSYGIATACLTLGVSWSFIRFFLPGDETIITKDPKSYALVIVAVLLSVAFVLGTR